MGISSEIQGCFSSTSCQSQKKENKLSDNGMSIRTAGEVKALLVQCPDTGSSHAKAECEIKRRAVVIFFFSQNTCWPLAMIRCFLNIQQNKNSGMVSAFLSLYRYFFLPIALASPFFKVV